MRAFWVYLVVTERFFMFLLFLALDALLCHLCLLCITLFLALV